jgi:GT2 family glycosyltransferase
MIDDSNFGPSKAFRDEERISFILKIAIDLKNVSIVIPNWNGRNLLAEYLPSVVAAAHEYRARSKAEVEVLLIDDGSTDDSVDWLRTNYIANDVVKIVELGTNAGFLRAVNKGFQAASYELAFLLNNDVRAEKGCIEPLVKHFDDDDAFAVCCRAGRIGSDRLDGGGKVGQFDRGFWRVFLNYEAVSEETTEELLSFYGSGGYTMYDREKWNELGGFQDILSPNYWEDVEICYRAWKRGWKIKYEPASKVTHLGSASMSRKSRHELNVTTERNRLLMTWINLHDPRMFASHIFWLSLILLGSVISMKRAYLLAFRQAWANLSKVRELRSIERTATRFSDKELQEKFAAIGDKKGIYLVATEADEIAFATLNEKNTL